MNIEIKEELWYIYIGREILIIGEVKMTETNIGEVKRDKIVMRTGEEVLKSMEEYHQWRMSNDVGYYADQMAKKNKEGTLG